MLTETARKVTTVLLVDDHALLREGLRALLNRFTEFEVIGEAENGYLGLMAINELKPDIVILDLNLGGNISGFDVIYEIRRQRWPVKILVLTANSYSRHAAASEMGADRCMLKEDPDADLIRNLRELAGEPVKTDYSLNYSNQVKTVPDLVSPREIELIKLGAEGYSQEEIARALSLKEQSVNVFCTRMYAKLGVKNMAAAVNFAVRNKLI